jgi:hypothetical protein
MTRSLTPLSCVRGSESINLSENPLILCPVPHGSIFRLAAGSYPY